MAAEMTEIKGLNERQPLFQEFCKVHGLQEGAFYRDIDYLFWVDGLPFVKQLEIIRKYQPDFKMKGCNL